MQIMYCYIEPWILNQNVYLMNDNETVPVMTNKVPLDSVASYLATCYNNKECDKIILHGSAKIMTEQIAEDVITYGNTNFGINNINIEVIK